MYTADQQLFLWLNFDGGHATDAAMSLISGTPLWIPFYALILWLVWHRYQWRGLLIFALCLIAAMGAADMLCGIFKHSGPLKHLWADFPARLRPMWTASLDGLVHVPSYAHGQFGTVSSHAATVTAMAVLSAATIRRRWFTWTVTAIVLLICYSRIYLACHFPLDLLLGAATGALTGWVMWLVFKRFATEKVD